MANVTKCASTRTADGIVLRLLGPEHDPEDRKQIEREHVTDYWATMGALARQRHANGERARLYEKTFRDVREDVLTSATRAATSHGAGVLVPLVALYRLRGGAEWPV